MRQVLAAVGLREGHEQVALGQVADREHVEEAVVGLGLGADDHPAAEGAPVRDDDVVHAAAADLVVDRDADLAVLPAREDGERRPEVGDLAAERLRRLVRALRDRAAHACARDVREVRLAVAPVPGAEVDAAEVDRARLAGQRHVDRAVELVRDPVGADEVPARAARDDRDLDALEPGDPVRDLVHRAVAADDDEQRRAAERPRRARARRAGPAAPRRACRPRAPS